MTPEPPFLRSQPLYTSWPVQWEKIQGMHWTSAVHHPNNTLSQQYQAICHIADRTYFPPCTMGWFHTLNYKQSHIRVPSCLQFRKPNSRFINFLIHRRKSWTDSPLGVGAGLMVCIKSVATGGPSAIILPASRCSRPRTETPFTSSSLSPTLTPLVFASPTECVRREMCVEGDVCGGRRVHG